MDKLYRRYCNIFDKAWLSINMASKSLGSSKEEKPSINDESSCATLEIKPAFTNLTEQESISESIDGWQHVEDKILRVLTYKYYDRDLKLLHSNDKYLQDTASAFCLEEEMETLHLQEFVDMLFTPVEVEVTRTFLPVSEEAQVVTVDEGNSCRRALKCVRNVLTLKSCRHTTC